MTWFALWSLSLMTIINYNRSSDIFINLIHMNISRADSDSRVCTCSQNEDGKKYTEIKKENFDIQVACASVA